MCLEEAPLLRRDQYANCAKRYSVSSSEAKSRDLCRARMRRNEHAENESTILHMIRVAPWRRGAPKAENRCASKRHPFYAETSMPTVQSATPYRQRKRSREIFAALVCDVTSGLRNESTVLHMIRVAPWRRRRIDVPRRGTLLRSGQYGNCAKRHSVSSFRAKREIFVIRGLAVNDWKFQTGNLLSTYRRASPHIYCSKAATTTLNPEPSSLFENPP